MRRHFRTKGDFCTRVKKTYIKFKIVEQEKKNEKKRVTDQGQGFGLTVIVKIINRIKKK